MKLKFQIYGNDAGGPVPRVISTALLIRREGNRKEYNRGWFSDRYTEPLYKHTSELRTPL